MSEGEQAPASRIGPESIMEASMSTNLTRSGRGMWSAHSSMCHALAPISCGSTVSAVMDLRVSIMLPCLDSRNTGCASAGTRHISRELACAHSRNYEHAPAARVRIAPSLCAAAIFFMSNSIDFFTAALRLPAFPQSR